jgi:hypothetical protein
MRTPAGELDVSCRCLDLSVSFSNERQLDQNRPSHLDGSKPDPPGRCRTATWHGFTLFQLGYWANSHPSELRGEELVCVNPVSAVVSSLVLKHG